MEIIYDSHYTITVVTDTHNAICTYMGVHMYGFQSGKKLSIKHFNQYLQVALYVHERYHFHLMFSLYNVLRMHIRS